MMLINRCVVDAAAAGVQESLGRRVVGRWVAGGGVGGARKERRRRGRAACAHAPLLASWRAAPSPIPSGVQSSPLQELPDAGRQGGRRRPASRSDGAVEAWRATSVLLVHCTWVLSMRAKPPAVAR